MSHLSKELSKYYTRDQSKIIFLNTLSLSTLAMEMYEKLGYKQIDPSVISRVLKGERLFTHQQLETFCQVLRLSSNQQIKLFKALQDDILEKKGYKAAEILHSTQNEKLEITESLINEAFFVLYEGRAVALRRLVGLIDNYILQLSSTFLSELNQQKLQELTGLHMYLQGRYIACVSLPETTIPQMSDIAQKLFSLSKESKNAKLNAYGNILMSDAYYIAGSYSKEGNKKSFYVASIKYGKKAWELLDDTNHYKLLALRNIAASSIYLEEKQTFSAIRSTVEKILEKQSIKTANQVYALQLCGTIDRGSAAFKLDSQMKMREKGSKHFGSNLSGFGSFDISDIRELLETLTLMQSKEKTYMQKLITKGSILAEQDKLLRYQAYFNKINLSS